MNYIVVDFEMNPVASEYREERKICRSEIIEIGAVIMDEGFMVLGEFKTLVKPQYNDVIYKKYETLTGIGTQMVHSAPTFSIAYEMFVNWCESYGSDYEIYAWSENDYNQLRTEVKLKNYMIYHITREPQKICIKGKAIINIGGTEVDISGFEEGIEFQVSELINIKLVKLMVPNFMTIENRTAYLRYAKGDVVVFYLGGYANRYQRDFIKTVYMSNRDANYLHFGDIDAGGFWIHHNLCEITGVNFELFSMSADELGNKEFASCLHELSDNDRVRLQELKKIDVYGDVVHICCTIM